MSKLMERLRGRAGEPPADSPADTEATPADTEAPPADTEATPADTEATPVDTEATPAGAPPDALAERLAELERRDRELTRRETRIEAARALAERGLPAALLDALPLESGEALRAALPGVEAAFRQALEDAVRARLSAAPPARLRGETPRDRALRDAMGLG